MVTKWEIVVQWLGKRGLITVFNRDSWRSTLALVAFLLWFCRAGSSLECDVWTLDWLTWDMWQCYPTLLHICDHFVSFMLLWTWVSWNLLVLRRFLGIWLVMVNRCSWFWECGNCCHCWHWHNLGSQDACWFNFVLLLYLHQRTFRIVWKLQSLQTWGWHIDQHSV